jgi:hypothetical protein
MRNLTICGLALILMATVSCTKEDDNTSSAPSSQTTSARLQDVTFKSDVEPLMRKSCNAANCHNSLSQNSMDNGRLMAAVADGSFNKRIFVLGSSTPCGNIDADSRAILQAWVSNGASMK